MSMGRPRGRVTVNIEMMVEQVKAEILRSYERDFQAEWADFDTRYRTDEEVNREAMRSVIQQNHDKIREKISGISNIQDLISWLTDKDNAVYDSVDITWLVKVFFHDVTDWYDPEEKDGGRSHSH